ncbi:uncharacterized protein LOC135396240 [Ornithodoros turicata]|uniref:uncharacterized protein LOC135396240 n=1 Tax=Ornithodoros turicata TaxID=34597 RepID=UPI003138FB71
MSKRINYCAELILSLCDEVYHLSRFIQDGGIVVDCILHGYKSAHEVVQFIVSIYFVCFHLLFLGPRNPLVSDAGIFFSDLLFHYFHMIYDTWILTRYLWSSKRHYLPEYLAHWAPFIFHTGIVWIWCQGVQVSVRMHLTPLRVAQHPPPPLPPPPPPPSVPPPPPNLHLQPLPPGDPIPHIDVDGPQAGPSSAPGQRSPLRNVQPTGDPGERTALYDRLVGPHRRTSSI